MSRNLVPLREGDGSSFVFVHSAGGLATAFRRLAPYLDGAGSVFAFENVEPDGAPPTIGELAERYWTELAAAATDPLILIGWSFGASVALELAALAEQAGRTVRAVVMLDAGAPGLVMSSPSLPLTDLAGLFGIPASDLPAGEAPGSEAEILDLLVDVLRRTRSMPGIEAADLEPFVAIYRWHHAAVRRPWTFRAQGAPVFLIRARDETCWEGAPGDLGWSDVLGRPPLISWTPGTHHDLLSDEHAPGLARRLLELVAGAAENLRDRVAGAAG